MVITLRHWIHSLRKSPDRKRAPSERLAKPADNSTGELQPADEIQVKITKSLRYSVIDGTFYCMMVGLGESFFGAFAVFLKATNFQLGLLGTLPQVLGSVLQLFSQKLVARFHSRKRFICLGALLQALMYIPIALVFFGGPYQVYFLILAVSLYTVCGMIIGPPWTGWMGDLVNERKRGTYFGMRNRVTGLASFLSLLAGGYILHCFPEESVDKYLGFAMLFGLACFCRLVSFGYLSRKYEPPYESKTPSIEPFLSFVRHLRSGNYGLYVAFLCTLNFSIFVAVPFFVPFMLKDLALDHQTFAMINSIPMITRLAVIHRWGRVADRFGTRKVLALTAFLIPLAPIFWLFSGKIWYLMLIQVYSGFVWAGFEIASFNFFFETTSSEQRISYISYYNVLNGFCILGGGLAGALLVRYNHLFWSKYFLVFLLSGLLRYIVVFLYIPQIKETRTVEPISYPRLLWQVIINRSLKSQGKAVLDGSAQKSR